MNLTVRSVYENKAMVGQIEDISGLIDIIHTHIPHVQAYDNHDRTISIECDRFEGLYDQFKDSISRWLTDAKVQLTCSAIHVFNVMPLTPSNILLRI